MSFPVRAHSLAAVALLAASTLAAQQPVPLSAFQRQKAQTLLEQKLPCLGCHALQGKGGAIGPDLSAVGARLDAQRIRAQIENPRAIMPRIALSSSTRDLIVAFLAEQKAAGATAARTTPVAYGAGQTPVEQLYRTHCAACHGVRGAGDGWNAATLDRPPAKHADARAMSTRSDDRLFDAIYAGGMIMNGSARMPPFGQSFNTQQIRSLVAYIRQLCNCRQPAWADEAR